MSARSQRSLAIDALRGAAALAVVLYHARGIFYIGGTRAFEHGLRLDLATLQAVATLPFRYGYLGVQLFFVLSGYCIHRAEAQRLALDPTRRLDSVQFGLRRIWRIYPTYICALLLSAAVDLFLVSRGARAPGASPLSWQAFLASVASLQGYVAPQYSSNGVFWTLAVELHLYAAYPLLHWLSRRLGPWRVFAITGLASGGYILLSAALDLQRYFPHRGVNGPVFLPYWFTWAAGFLIAECEAGRARLPRGWALAAWAGAAWGLSLTLLGRDDLSEMGWALAFAGLVQWSIGPAGRSRMTGRTTTALAFLGLFSYSLYATHAPVQMALMGVLSPTGERYASTWPMAVAACVSVAAAYLVFQAVERWSLRWPFQAPAAPARAAPARPAQTDGTGAP